MKRAIFLDRDGTISVDKGYTSNPENIEFIPSVLLALWAFLDAGYLLILVSNQSSIVKGYFSDVDYKRVQERLDELLLEQRVKIAAYYH